MKSEGRHTGDAPGANISPLPYSILHHHHRHRNLNHYSQPHPASTPGTRCIYSLSEISFHQIHIQNKKYNYLAKRVVDSEEVEMYTMYALLIGSVVHWILERGCNL